MNVPSHSTPIANRAGDLAGLVVSLSACTGAAVAGSLLTTPSIPTWYAGLSKPFWTPPNSAFPVVWPILYFLMALAAWLVWRKRGERPVGWPLAVFAAQLALNVAWSGLFFALRRPDLAFVEVVALWLAILATLITFGRVSRPAAVCLVPYLAWVGYAAALNLAIWRMNA